MRHLLTRLPLLSALLLALLAVATPASAATLKIGLIASQTGAGAPYGASQVAAAQVAVAKGNPYNQQMPIELLVRDDGSTPDGAKAAMTDLLDQNVSAVLGPTLSTAAFQADPIAQARGVPVLAISNTADGIPEIGDAIFRVSLSESAVLPVTVSQSQRYLHYRRAAILHRSDNASSVSGAATFRTALKREEVKRVGDIGYTGDAPDLRSKLRALARRRPQALLITGLAADSVAVMKQARATKGLERTRFIGGNGLNTPAVIQQAGRAAEGAIVGASFNVHAVASRGWVANWRDETGTDPDQFEALTALAIDILIEANRRGLPLRVALPSVELGHTPEDSPVGRFSFTPAREPVYDPVIQVIRRGQYLPLTARNAR